MKLRCIVAVDVLGTDLDLRRAAMKRGQNGI
jgi:hypothetical protein